MNNNITDTDTDMEKSWQKVMPEFKAASPGPLYMAGAHIGFRYAWEITTPTLLAEVKRLRAALERVGSSEAITMPFYNDGKSNEGKELIARMDYARKALNTEQHNDP